MIVLTLLSDSYEPGLALIIPLRILTQNTHIFITKIHQFHVFINPSLALFSYIHHSLPKILILHPYTLSKMATESIQQTKIILARSEDWEKWYRQLRGHVDREIWSLLDPEMNEENEEELIEQSQKPRFRDYNHNATMFMN